MQITKKQTFYIQPNIANPVEIKFLNRLGGWDSIQFTKHRQYTVKANPDQFQNSNGTKTSQVNIQSKTTFFSLYLTENDFHWLKDLYGSPAIIVNNEYHNLEGQPDIKFDTEEQKFVIELTLSSQSEEKTLSL